MRFLILLFSLFVSVAQADEVKIIVPYAPGGYADQTARVLQAALIEELKTTVMVDFKLGAGGSIATAYTNSAPQSEKIIQLDAIGIISNNLTDTESKKTKNVHCLANIGYVQSIFVVSKKSGIKNWNDFLRVSQAKTLAYGSAGIGSTLHVFPEIMASKIDRQFIHVPFKGQAAVLPMLLSGEVDFAFINKPTIMQHIQSGAVIPIAIIAHKRISDLPNIPTLAEKNVKGLEDFNWLSAFTNQPIDSDDYKRLHSVLQIVLHDVKVVSALNEIGLGPSQRINERDFVNREKQRLARETQNLKLE